MSLSDRTADHLRNVLAAPDLRDTPYEIVEEIARGGMGTVYLALDHKLDRQVALKVLPVPLVSPAAKARMLKEARILARLEHPAIVPVHDVGTLADGRVFYTMKWVQGRQLDHHLEADDLPLGERLRMFGRICEGVAFAHARGVLHRDLKPQNVMVGEFGEVLVLDWGVAKILGEPEPPAEGAEPGPEDATRSLGAVPTQAGTVLGTPGYMPPEQAAGEIATLDARADVFALGRILEDLAGDSCPRRLRSIVAKATAPDPADRYPAAGDLARDVARFADGDSVSAHRESPWERVGRLAHRYRTPLLVFGTYLLVRLVLLLLGA